MTNQGNTHPTTSPAKCSHLMHLPSGKCLGCGEQHQPRGDYQPGDDEAYTREHLAEDSQPQSPSTSEAEVTDAMIEAAWGLLPYQTACRLTKKQLTAIYLAMKSKEESND